MRYVLQGSVRKTKRRVLVDAQLIDTATDYDRWSERFERDLDDIFALQDEITHEVVAALQLNLTGDERKLMEQRFTEDVEAYESYLRGIELYRRKTRQAVYQARRWLQRAIDLDPRFSEAHARLAHTYFYAFEAGWEGPASLNRAVELAQNAVALDELREALLPE